MGYVSREERERSADEFYLEGLLGRTHDQRGQRFADPFPESPFYDRVGPGPACYARGSPPSSVYFSGSAYSPYAPPRGLEPHDVDMILVRLLEGYRILDELFNPRSVRRQSQAKATDPRPESSQVKSN